MGVWVGRCWVVEVVVEVELGNEKESKIYHNRVISAFTVLVLTVDS